MPRKLRPRQLDTTALAAVLGTTGGGENPPPTGPEPMYVHDYMTAAYTGAPLSDLQVVAGARTVKNSLGQDVAIAENQPGISDLGLWVSAAQAEYVSRHSVNPIQWGQYDWYNAVGTALPADGMFQPVLFPFADAPDATGAARTPGFLTRNVAPGEQFTIVYRVKKPQNPRPADQPTGAMIVFSFTNADNIQQKTRTIFWSNIDQPSTTLQNGYNPDNVDVAVKRSETMPGGSVEFELLVTVPPPPAGQTISKLRLGVASANQYNPDTQVSKPSDLIIYGLHVQSGPQFTGWVATTNTGITQQGEVLTLTGTMDNPLTDAGGGTIVIEVQDTAPRAAPTPSQILSSGANDNYTILGLDGYTAVAAANAAKSVGFGISGCAGIFRVVLARDANGWSACVNEGEVISGPEQIGVAEGIRLMRTLTGRVRRIEGYAGRLTDAQVRTLSSLRGRSFPRPGDAFVPTPSATVTFEENWNDPGTIKVRPDGANWLQVGNEDAVAQYKNLPGKWIPRYLQFTDASGSAPIARPQDRPPNGAANNPDQQINQEWQVYVDPTWPGWAVDGYQGPLKVENGRLRIRAEYVGDDRPNLLGLLPDRPQTPGTKYRYVSGCLVSAGYFEQRFGYFDARIRVPKGQGLWPAFWMLQGVPAGMPGGPFYSSETELDILEYVGKNPTETTGAIHADNYAYNSGSNYSRGFDLSLDFHSYSCHWVPGEVRFYLDGKLWKTEATGGTNFDNFPQYFLLNVAVGDNGSWIGTPDASTAAGSPYDMLVDRVVALQTQAA